MEEKEIIEAIKCECDAENGFVVQLNALNLFNEEKFKSIFNLIQAYYVLTLDKDEINREVAGCLISLFLVLGNRLSHIENNQIIHPDKNKISKAHQEVANLMEDFLKAY